MTRFRRRGELLLVGGLAAAAQVELFLAPVAADDRRQLMPSASSSQARCSGARDCRCSCSR